MFIVAVILIMAFPITVALTNKNPNNRIASFFRVTNSICDGNGCQDYSGAGGIGADQALQTGTGLIGGVYNPATQNGGVQNQLYNNPVNYQGQGIMPQAPVQTAIQYPAGLNSADSNPNSATSPLCYQSNPPCAAGQQLLAQQQANGTLPAAGNPNAAAPATTNVQQPVTYCAGGTNTQTCYQTGNSCTCTANSSLPAGMVPYNGTQDTYNPSTGKWIDSGTTGNPIVGVTPVVNNGTGAGYVVATPIPAAQARPIATAPTAVPTTRPAEANVVTPIPANNGGSGQTSGGNTQPTPVTEAMKKAAMDDQAAERTRQDQELIALNDQTTSNITPQQQLDSLNQQATDLQKQIVQLDNASADPFWQRGLEAVGLSNVNALKSQAEKQLNSVQNKIKSLSKILESDSANGDITPTPSQATIISCNPIKNYGDASQLSINIPSASNLCDPSVNSQASEDYVLFGPRVDAGLAFAGIGKNTNVGQNNKLSSPFVKTQVELLDKNNKDIRDITMNIVYNPTTGEFNDIIPLGSNIPAGTYKIKVRTNNSLWKDAGNITLTPGQKANLPSINLVSGDLNQDNRLDLSDYTAIISCITNKSCTAGSIADLNQDGKFDEEDLNILYSNFKTRQGD